MTLPTVGWICVRESQIADLRYVHFVCQRNGRLARGKGRCATGSARVTNNLAARPYPATQD